MARTETKNIVAVNSPTQAASGTVSVQMNVPDDLQMNFHNIWMSICITPNDADANANGYWVLYLEPDSTAAVFNPSIAALNLETINFKIIACGCWHASNQAPYNLGVPLGKTSRNVRQNGRLILVTQIEGITAGNTNVDLMLCAGSKTI